MDHVVEALSNCGYPKWSVTSALFPRNRQAEPTTRPKTLATIPYVSGLSEHLQRVFKEHNIKVAHKPVNTLRQQLVHPKDTQEKECKSGVVYGINCEEEDCAEYYVGETEQPLKKRMYQHRRASNGGITSAVFEHMRESGHSFNNQDVDILSREPRWFERGVKEAIYVKTMNPSLNKHGGVRHKLSSAWNENLASIVKSRDNNANSRQSAIPIEGSETLPMY